MKEKLEQAKNEIAKEYGYVSFEQFDDKSTFSYDHTTPEIINNIAIRYHELMEETRFITIGDKIVAIDECRMDDNTGNALIIGKSYRIDDISYDCIIIKSELFGRHKFLIKELNEFFKPKQQL